MTKSTQLVYAVPAHTLPIDERVDIVGREGKDLLSNWNAAGRRQNSIREEKKYIKEENYSIYFCELVKSTNAFFLPSD